MNNSIVHEWLMSLSPTMALITEGDEEKKWETKYYFGIESFLVRVLRGHKMKTVPDLMNEFSSSLQFFDQFGENWYALSDCLQIDLEKWMPFEGILLVVKHAEDVLSLQDDQLIWLLVVIHEVGIYWSHAIDNDERYNRPAYPFHVIFETSEANFHVLVNKFQKIVNDCVNTKISFQIFHQE